MDYRNVKSRGLTRRIRREFPDIPEYIVAQRIVEGMCNLSMNPGTAPGIIGVGVAGSPTVKLQFDENNKVQAILNGEDVAWEK